jgi:hypothetical protein
VAVNPDSFDRPHPPSDISLAVIRMECIQEAGAAPPLTNAEAVDKARLWELVNEVNWQRVAAFIRRRRLKGGYLMNQTILIACLAATTISAQQPSNKNRTCPLLTEAEVEQAIGAVTSGGIPNPRMDSCRFQLKDGSGAVAVTASRDASGDAAAKVAAAKQLMKNAKITDVAGLGDRAILIRQYGMGATVSIFRGPDNLQVMVLLLGSPQKSAAAAEVLARKAFARF